MKPLEISPEEFRRLAEQVTHFAAEYLADLDSHPTFPNTSGAETEQLFHTALPENGLGAKALTSLREVIKHSRVQNGRFLGYVLGSGEPVGAVADLLASMLNQNVTAWRSAPAAVTIERTVVEWLAQAIGCSSFRGSLTGGGSSANLIALAMAREAPSPAATICGCMWMALMAHWLRSQRPASSLALIWPTRFPSTRTSGSISLWTVVVCFTATQAPRRPLSPTRATMPRRSAPIRSKVPRSLKNHLNFRAASAR